MNWNDSVKQHLGNYRTNVLNVTKRGKWENGEYEHILPSENQELNLLETYRDSFWKSKWKNMEFSPFFPHLNSSQAMCLNFFYPLIEEKKIELLLEKLGIKGETVKYETVEFEKKSDLDSTNAKFKKHTSFDFYFETNNKKFYFEVKYTEPGFGSEGEDAAHVRRYEAQYKELAQGKIRFKTDDDCKEFLDNYQLMRNLMHVSDDSYVVFIVPKNNEEVCKKADEAPNFVDEKYRDKVKVLYWDCLVEELQFEGTLKTHFEEFKRKYKL
ncbi:hypothetical protein SAMD00024442_96_1 [Candidatus Symbiothrix dinenymphae]|nr:hypothetical protein SAMD00024442_96_1 [Candidatus Symbiothrix dinenymphae]